MLPSQEFFLAETSPSLPLHVGQLCENKYKVYNKKTAIPKRSRSNLIFVASLTKPKVTSIFRDEKVNFFLSCLL